MTKKRFYQSPATRVVGMFSGSRLLSGSFDGQRNDYGEAEELDFNS